MYLVNVYYLKNNGYGAKELHLPVKKGFSLEPYLDKEPELLRSYHRPDIKDVRDLLERERPDSLNKLADILQSNFPRSTFKTKPVFYYGALQGYKLWVDGYAICERGKVFSIFN